MTHENSLEGSLSPAEHYQELRTTMLSTCADMLQAEQAQRFVSAVGRNVQQVGVLLPSDNPVDRTADRMLTVVEEPYRQGNDVFTLGQTDRSEGWSDYAIDPQLPTVDKVWQGHNTRQRELALGELQDLADRIRGAQLYNPATEKVVNGRIVPKNKLKALGRRLLGNN